MAYEKRISTARPGLIVLLLDDSQSMSLSLAGTTDPKYVWVERYVGIVLKELLTRSYDPSGETMVVKPRYFVHVITYGGCPSAWSTEEKGIDIQTAVQKYVEAQNSLGLGGKLGGTDTAAAFNQALQFLERALDKYKSSFPPLVFHLTDGESQTDAEPISQRVSALSTDDGAVLICNAFIGAVSNLTYKGPEDFEGYCSEEEAGPAPDCARLFRMSSVMPAAVRSNLIADSIFPKIRDGARLFFDVRTKDTLKHTIQVVGSTGSRV